MEHENNFSKLSVLEEQLLYIHAMSGCDTTSAPFGKGKSSFLRSVMKSGALNDISDKMNDI